jgi:hypothetical protein
MRVRSLSYRSILTSAKAPADGYTGRDCYTKYMITSTRNKYITQLLDTPGRWPILDTGPAGYNSHLLPTLLDAQWGQAFETATMQQRENLARGWIWSYAIKQHIEKFDSYGKAESWCLERCANWIQKIEPYVPSEDHTEELDSYKITCGVLLHRDDRAENVTLRSLWFGTDKERLSLLLSILDDASLRGIRHMVSSSKTSHNRVFEISALPGATRQHEISAAYIATKAGLARETTTPAISEPFSQWHQLGVGMSMARPIYQNECEGLIKSRRFFQAQRPEIAVPVFTRIIHDELEHYLNVMGNSLGSLFWKPGGTAEDVVKVTIKNIYTALSDWLPAYRQQWEAAASLGLPVLEAGQLISHTLSNSSEIVELPADLTIA